MSRRSHLWNAFAATTTNPVTAGQDIIPLSTVAGLAAPGKLVIDHADDSKREWFSFAGITGTSLTGCVRGLAGSSGAGGGVAHDQGAIVQSVPMHQHFDDLFDDIEDLEDLAGAHTGAANPHPGYATDSDLAATNAVVATHTSDIGVLEATDVTFGTDIDNLELSTAAHYGSTNGHPVATDTTDGFISAADFAKLRDRFGAGCRARSSLLQTLDDNDFQYVSFDIDDYIHPPAPAPPMHNPPGGSLFVIPYTGLWSVRFANAAQTAMRRTVRLRQGGTPGTGAAHTLANGAFDPNVTTDRGRNVCVLGPERFVAGTQWHLELGDEADGSGNVGANSAITWAFHGP